MLVTNRASRYDGEGRRIEHHARRDRPLR
jgi:YD repeat-containing protein